MQRNALRAVVLAALLVLSVVAGVGLGPATAAADDGSNFEPAGTEIQTGSDESFQHGFAEYDGQVYVAGATEDAVRVYDHDFDHQTTHDLAHQPAGLTRFDGDWIVASADSGTLERYDESFSHVETVADGFADESTAPWNIDSHDGQLFVADQTEVVVFDTEFSEVDRFDTDADPIAPLHADGGSVYVMDNAGDPVHEYTTDGESVDTYETGLEFDMGPAGMGLVDGHWYLSDGGDNDHLWELEAATEPATATVAGTVRDQTGTAVPDATVSAWGVREPALEDSSEFDDSETLLADIEDPLPDSFDREYDIDSHLEADSTYALAHTGDDWGVGTTHIADSSIDEPRVTVPSDRPVTLSLWDPSADGGWLENQVDQSFPGETVEGTIVVDQLGPGGDTTDSREYDTEVIAESTGANPLTTTEHHGVDTQLPAGIYRVAPEDNPAGGYVIAVGDPDDIASGIVKDLSDDAGDLTDRASEISELRDDDLLVRETTQADSDGAFALEMDTDVETVHVDAVGAETEALESITEPGVGDLETLRADGYNGSVYVPQPGLETAAPPAEDVTVDVYRTPDAPFGDLEQYDDLQEWLEAALLDDGLEVLLTPFETPLEDIEADVLETVEGDLEELADSNDDLADELDELEDIEDVSERVDELYDALERVESIEPGDSDGEIVEGDLEFWQEFGDSVSDAVVTVEYEDGTVETVPEEYVTIESAGWFDGDRVSIEGYDIGDRAVADVSVEAAGAAGVGSGGTTLENDAVAEDVPALESMQVSSLAPGPSERVSVGLAGGDVGLESAAVTGPDGEAVNASVEGERVAFDTDGEGVHTLVFGLESSGHEYQVVERVEAVEQSRSDPATVRVGESVVGEYAVVNGELSGGEVDVGAGEIDVTAEVEADDTPGSIHVYPDAALERDAYDIDVSLVEAGGGEVRSHVETVLHFGSDYYGAETIAWRNGDPITQDGSTRYGDVSERPADTDSVEKRVLFSYTDEQGNAEIETDTDPSVVDRVRHWGSTVVPRPTIPLDVGDVPATDRIEG